VSNEHAERPWSAMGARAVFLTGFMASGKTRVGRELAGRLGWKSVDLDERIAVREQQAVPEIFRERGEAGFRAAETSALAELIESLERDSIVALGGGAFVQEKNRELLKSWPTVFLTAPVDELWRRCSVDEAVRPLRTSQEQFARLYDERLSIYQEATITVETFGKGASSICAEIEAALGLSPVKTDSVDVKCGSDTGGSW
jgi:shikimate kinase